MLGRHHVNLAGFFHRASRLTYGIHDVVPLHLRNIHQAPHDALVALRLFLVQQSLVRLLVGEFGTVPRRVGRLAFRHSEPLQDGLRKILLRDLESATLKVSLYISMPKTSDTALMAVILKRCFNFSFTLAMASELLLA